MIKIGDIVTHKHEFTKRCSKVLDIRDNWEALIEDMTYKNGGSWWRLDSLKPITIDNFPEYFL